MSDGSNDTVPFAEHPSVIRDRLQQKRYWSTLRQNPETATLYTGGLIPSTIVTTVANSDLYFAWCPSISEANRLSTGPAELHTGWL